MDTALEISLLLLLLVLNGIFSMSEMAIVSARKGLLQQMAEKGDGRARAALGLAGNPGSFLSTVQVGITLVGIVAGAYGGATLSEKLRPVLQQVDWIRPHESAVSFGIVVAVITYLSLVVGELIPKRIALHSAERAAVLVARPMLLLAAVASPLVKVLEGSTNGLLRIFGLMDKSDPPITEEEIKILLEQGTKAGVFERAERDVIHRTLGLTDTRISVLMVPRTSMISLDLDDPRETITQILRESKRSRYPVVQGSPDNVVGVLRAKDVLPSLLSGNPLEVAALMLPPVFVPESMPAFRVLEGFRESGRHLAVVVDEYGGVEGLVTVNDILQALVGDIRSFDHSEDPVVVRREDGSWLLDGSLGIADLKRTLGISEFDMEGQKYETLAGFLMYGLQRIPRVSDKLEWEGFRFEVVDMDRRRIDRVLVTRIEDPKPGP